MNTTRLLRERPVKPRPPGSHSRSQSTSPVLKPRSSLRTSKVLVPSSRRSKYLGQHFNSCRTKSPVSFGIGCDLLGRRGLVELEEVHGLGHLLQLLVCPLRRDPA